MDEIIHDPLAVNLGSVDTTPLLPVPGVYDFIVTIALEPNKKGDGSNLVIEAKFLDASQVADINGRPIPPNYSTKVWMSLKQVMDENGKPKNNPMKSVAVFAKALFGDPLPENFGIRDLLATGQNQVARGVLKHEVYEGAPVPRISTWLPKARS